MRESFKVNLECYKYFVDEIEQEYINELENNYDSFEISYDNTTEPIGIEFFEVMEGNSDKNQILLYGAKENEKTVLAYIFVGDKYDELGNISEWYTEGMEDLKRIRKYRVINFFNIECYMICDDYGNFWSGTDDEFNAECGKAYLFSSELLAIVKIEIKNN